MAKYCIRHTCTQTIGQTKRNEKKRKLKREKTPSIFGCFGAHSKFPCNDNSHKHRVTHVSLRENKCIRRPHTTNSVDEFSRQQLSSVSHSMHFHSLHLCTKITILFIWHIRCSLRLSLSVNKLLQLLWVCEFKHNVNVNLFICWQRLSKWKLTKVYRHMRLRDDWPPYWNSNNHNAK